MQKVIEYLVQNENRFVNDLCDYLRFPSVSAQPKHKKDMAKAASWLAKRFKAAGLQAVIHPTPGNPVVVAKTPHHGKAGKPHFMVYGHYDVQPAEPFDLWKSPPFEPRIQGRSLFARGSSDNKGQHLAHLFAVEAYLKTGTELPCDLTFVIEGEEEVGSKSLDGFLTANARELACDAVVVSDTGMPSKQHPALTYALRGIAAFEVILRGPSRDLHSGIFGGSVENPAMALCQLLGKLRDKDGRINIPGFYDDVVPLTPYERKQMKRLPGNDADYCKFLGAPKLFGEKGYTSTEQRTSRPTLEINGLTSGYQGEGSKTIVPAWAKAKLTLRLVPDQKPSVIIKSLRSALVKLCPPTVTIEIISGHGAEPYLVSPSSKEAQAALAALRKAFGHEPVLMREGGSIPIVNQFKKHLKADTLLLGLALPDDNAHSPNEKFDLDCFAKGQLMSAYLWQELTK